MKINLNQEVLVTLTAKGAEIINEYNMIFSYPVKTDYKETDIYRSELRNICFIFGKHLHNQYIPFKNNKIII